MPGGRTAAHPSLRTYSSTATSLLDGLSDINRLEDAISLEIADLGHLFLRIHLGVCSQR